MHVKQAMDVVIRKTGNSKGVILPANVLKETGINKIAEMRVEKDCITPEGDQAAAFRLAGRLSGRTRRRIRHCFAKN